MLLHRWESWQKLPYFSSCACRRHQVWTFSNSSDGRVLQPLAAPGWPLQQARFAGEEGDSGQFPRHLQCPPPPVLLELSLLLMTTHSYSKVRDMRAPPCVWVNLLRTILKFSWGRGHCSFSNTKWKLLALRAIKPMHAPQIWPQKTTTYGYIPISANITALSRSILHHGNVLTTKNLWPVKGFFPQFQ